LHGGDIFYTYFNKLLQFFLEFAYTIYSIRFVFEELFESFKKAPFFTKIFQRIYLKIMQNLGSPNFPENPHKNPQSLKINLKIPQINPKQSIKPRKIELHKIH
jgi:hypothetical protein